MRGGSAGEAGVAGELLPGSDLRADAIEVAEEGIDGVVPERQAQWSVVGVQRREDSGRGLGRVAGLGAVPGLDHVPGRADGGRVVSDLRAGADVAEQGSAEGTWLHDQYLDAKRADLVRPRS